MFVRSFVPSLSLLGMKSSLNCVRSSIRKALEERRVSPNPNKGKMSFEM